MNSSHENQPKRILNWDDRKSGYSSYLNMTTNSYNLLIKNITDSHLGHYYCGTEKMIVEDGDKIVRKVIHRYGNVTTMISFGKLTLC